MRLALLRAAVLLLACLTEARADGKWVRRLRQLSLEARWNRLKAASRGRGRALTVDSASCGCVQNGWMSVHDGTTPISEMGETVLGSGCYAGLQADCSSGGELEGAPECDPTVLGEELMGMNNNKFYPSDAFKGWLISVSSQCQTTPVITEVSVSYILTPPMVSPLQWYETSQQHTLSHQLPPPPTPPQSP